MVLSLGHLEQMSLQQGSELQREERNFIARLQNMALLRNHVFTYQQRDKVEQLQNIHDKLLQQEFTLRKLRRIRTEVDSQRMKNEKLARELGKLKDELVEKESKVHLAKIASQKLVNGEKKATDVKEPLRKSAQVVENGSVKPHTETKLTAPMKVSAPALEPNGLANGNGMTNGHSVFHDNANNDDDEMATSFITGWTPSQTKSTLRPNFSRFSAADAELGSTQSSDGDDSTLGIESGSSENVRPASDFIAHGTLPTYRYVPRTQMFKQRIGVDGGRAKTVESLYKDFHPRALQQTAAVSILEESSDQQQGSAAGAGAMVSIAMVESESQFSENGSQRSASQTVMRSILVAPKPAQTGRHRDDKTTGRRVRFSPIALLLDAALDGDLELVRQLLIEIDDPSAPNDEGITALHNAICAGHGEMVELLVNTGCDVNSSDCDGWTGLHCAASCNNRQLCELLVENGAALFALTSPDRETPRDKCEPDEECFAECYAYLLECEEKLGRANDGTVYAAFDFKPSCDETPFDADLLQFSTGAKLKVLRRGDDSETNWWWAKLVAHGQGSDDVVGQEGYVPNSYLALYPRNEHWSGRYSRITS